MQPNPKTDVLIVGSGIVGMACALAAVDRGLSVQVLDRDMFCTSASIRNFGFITVTGQGRGHTWRRARQSRDIWAQIAPQAGIPIEHSGMYVLAQRPEAQAILQQLLLTEQGAELEWLSHAQLQVRAPHLAHDHILGALYSPHELRIESRVAVEQLRLWLQTKGVKFHMGESANHIETGRVTSNGREYHAQHIMVCPGADIRTLFPSAFAKQQTQLCQLQMLRVRPPSGYRLNAGVMGDTSLVRYRGYRELDGGDDLELILRREMPTTLEHGIHLIIVQSADGSLVVGDSHHYGASLPPFASAKVESLILTEMQRLLCLEHFYVEERWTGIYPSGMQDAFFESVLPGVQLVSVTSGTGMSTAFALAQDCFNAGDLA